MEEGHSATGYRRAPVNGQFKRGQSGNPRGRPKGSGTLSSVIEDVLSEPVRLKIQGRSVTVSGREALGIVLTRRAADGDIRTVRLLHRYGYFAKTDEPVIMWFDEADKNL